MRSLSSRQLLSISGAIIALGVIVALILSSNSSNNAAPTVLVKTIMAKNQSQTRVIFTETSTEPADTTVHSFDNTQNKSSLVMNGKLVYLQEGNQLWTHGQNCYFHSVQTTAPPPYSFVENLLPPATTNVTYTQPKTNELDWTLKIGDSNAHPTKGRVFFDPSSDLISSATITTTQGQDTATLSYPTTILFPANPSPICSSVTTGKTPATKKK